MTAVPTDLYVYSPCDTKRLMPFKTFTSMKDSLASGGNFAQRVRSADSLFFFFIRLSSDICIHESQKRNKGARDLLPAPSTEDKRRKYKGKITKNYFIRLFNFANVFFFIFSDRRGKFKRHFNDNFLIG